MSRRGYLLVTAGGRAVGLAVEGVIEVFTPEVVYPVPAESPAMRGVTPVRGRLVPLVHLGMLLGDAAPAVPGGTAVLVDAPRPIALEVESAEAVIHESLLPPPEGEQLPWAVGLAVGAAGPVPVLDLAAVVARLAAAESA